MSSITTNAYFPLSSSRAPQLGGVSMTAVDKRTKASAATALAAVAATAWQTRTTPNLNYRSVVWAPEVQGGIFVAVANTTSSTNTILTSTDGITWTSVSYSGTGRNWYSIAYAPELTRFVVVCYDNTATANTNPPNATMTSTDAVTWTTTTSPVDNGFQSVCWSSDLRLFCAVSSTGSGNRAMTSPDGVTWAARTTPDKAWQTVIWISELYTFVAFAPDAIMTSPNGITWTSRSVPAGWARAWGACWSPDLQLLVVAMGDINNVYSNVFTTSDLTTWTARPLPANVPGIRSIAWAPELGMFCAPTFATYSTATGAILTSFDGITWTSRVSPVPGNWSGIAWSPELSLFVGVGANATTLAAMSSAIAMPSARNVVKALPSQVMVDRSGNVGIGTTNPVAAFQVTATGTAGVGNKIVDFRATNHNERIYIIDETNNGQKPAGVVGPTGYGLGFYARTSTAPIAFFQGSGDTERMRIAAGGNVGIGTANPLASLHVNGDVSVARNLTITSNVDLIRPNGKISSRTVVFPNTPNSQAYTLFTNDSDGAFYVSSSSGTGVYLTWNGSSWSGYSDSNLKKDVIPLSNMLEKLKMLEPVRFKWKTDEEGANFKYGLIAQDVQGVFPDLVDNIRGHFGMSNLLGLSYTNLVPIMLQSIKEQNVLIENLISNVAALENRISNIETNR